MGRTGGGRRKVTYNMRYDFACTKCGAVQEEVCSVDKFKEFEPKCVKCGAKCIYKFNPKGIEFILIDGPTGSWPSKGGRIQAQRIKASHDASRRQKNRYGNIKTKAIPNYKGNEASDWTEAKEMATKDVGSEKAASYDSKIAEERATKII